MASVREVRDRARRWAALALIALAAAFIVRSMTHLREGPGREAEDQVLLDEMRTFLAPVEQLVPEGEPLRFLQPLDSLGRPIFERDSFAHLQAVLAPRRIGREIEARFLLVHHRTPEGLRLVPGLEHTRVLAQLAEGLVLMERAGP